MQIRMEDFAIAVDRAIASDPALAKRWERVRAVAPSYDAMNARQRLAFHREWTLIVSEAWRFADVTLRRLT